MTDELSREPRFRAGVAEFNAGRYFEAHEVWEELWLELVGEEKSLLQGLIQIAAGYFKFTQGNRGATRKLFEKALVRIAAAGDHANDPRIVPLLDVIRAQMDRLADDSSIRAPVLTL